MSSLLKKRAALRRFSQSQSERSVQNAVMQTGTDTSDRMVPSAQVGRFNGFNAEAGKYEFSSDTGSTQIDPGRMLANGKLGVGQKALLAQDFADYSHAG